MLFGAVADDMTGAVELTSMLVAQGVHTDLLIGNECTPVATASACVVALKTRVAAPEAAVSAVLRATDLLADAGCRQFFFKYCATFDSTPRGNIGPCAEAMMDRLGAVGAGFCPTFAEFERTVYQGYHFVGNMLLSESPKRLDPLTPMTDSNLVRVLQAQSKRRVGLVPLNIVRLGSRAIQRELKYQWAAGQSLSIIDATTEDDLREIAEANADFLFCTGNSSIAAYFPEVWRRRGWMSRNEEPGPLPAVEGPAAVLSGSCAEQTRDQLIRFGRTNPVLHLDIEHSSTADVESEALDWAKPHIEATTPVAIATGADPTTVARLQQQYGRVAVAEKAESILAELAHQLVNRMGVRRLIVAGGETSGTVLSRLGITRLNVGSYTGAGMARCTTLSEDPIGLVLKSGKLGHPNIFIEALEEMQRPQSPRMPLQMQHHE